MVHRRSEASRYFATELEMAIWSVRPNLRTRLSAQITVPTKAFLVLWVGGTVGGFFSALMRSVPLHLGQLAWPSHANRAYTSDLVLRYGYLAWLIIYFGLSNSADEGEE
jgi:hypothetical protein